MSKRLTDTEIWEQDWYIDLPNKYKLLWNFIKDKCDDCGVWRPNKSLLQRIIGEPINLDEFLTFINIGGKERIRILQNGRWFLIEYFFFQYGDKFNPKSPVHRGAMKRLLQNNLHPKELSYLHIGNLINIDIQELKEIGYQKGTDSILKAYGYDSDRDKVIDKDNAKDKDILEITDIVIDSTKAEVMLIVEMMKIWDKEMPGYVHEKTTDYHACLNIAYKIAEAEGWMKADVVESKKTELLGKWMEYAKFISNHKWFSGLTLDSLAASKIWQKVSNDFKNMPATGLKMPLVKGLDDARQEYLQKMNQK